jgi:hypothetical protein
MIYLLLGSALLTGFLIGGALWWQDSRRYRLLREELQERWVLGGSIPYEHPEELDARCDAALAGEWYWEQEEDEPDAFVVPEHKQPDMPGWQPLFGGMNRDP